MMQNIATRGNSYNLHDNPQTKLGLFSKSIKPPKENGKGYIGNGKPQGNPKKTPRKVQILSLSELGFHGFRRISATERFSSQIAWSFLCIICLAVCAFQCSDRIKYFVYQSPSVNMKMLKNATIHAPCVTICPSEITDRNPSVWKPWLKQRYNITQFTNAYELLEITNMTIGDLWNISRIGMKNFRYGTPKGYSLMNGLSMDHSNIIMEEIYTTAGICTTLKPRKPLQCVGVRANLFAESESDVGAKMHHEYSVVFHAEEDIAITKYFFRHLEVQLPYKSDTLVGIRLQQFTFLDTWANPCSDGTTVAKCLTDCIEDKIFSYVNKSLCRLPYMRQNGNIPPCETLEEFREVYTATDTAITGFDWDRCNCPRKCKEIVYFPEFYFSLQLPKARSDDHLFRLYITFPDCRVEAVDEVSSYSFFSLFSDIGGTLGLFLGISTLSFCELFEVMLAKIVRPRL